MEFELKMEADFAGTEEEYDIAIDTALNRIAAIIQHQARNQHRYQNRSGRLRNATKVDRVKDQVRAFIDDTQASYGRYIHDGKGNRAPDPFIGNAIKRNEGLIERIIVEELDKAYA